MYMPGGTEACVWMYGPFGIVGSREISSVLHCYVSVYVSRVFLVASLSAMV